MITTTTTTITTTTTTTIIISKYVMAYNQQMEIDTQYYFV